MINTAFLKDWMLSGVSLETKPWLDVCFIRKPWCCLDQLIWFVWTVTVTSRKPQDGPARLPREPFITRCACQIDGQDLLPSNWVRTATPSMAEISTDYSFSIWYMYKDLHTHLKYNRVTANSADISFPLRDVGPFYIMSSHDGAACCSVRASVW